MQENKGICMNYPLRVSNAKNSKQKQLTGLPLSRGFVLRFIAEGKTFSRWKEPPAHAKPAARSVCHCHT